VSAVPSKARFRPGCFGYGCLIAIVLFSAIICGIGYLSVSSLRSAVNQYTVRDYMLEGGGITPKAVEPEALQSARGKGDAILSAYNSNRELKISLSADEIRAFLSVSPWHRMLELGVEGDELILRFSFPLAMLGDWGAAKILVPDITKRGVIGSAAGAFSIKNGVPTLKLSRLVLRDSELGDMARSHAAEWIVGALVDSGKLSTRLRSLEVVAGEIQLELGQ
jgi:hypothetical protein